MATYNTYHGEFLDGYYVDQIIRSYFPNKNNGVFFDVGAFEPVRISNSFHFEQNGWDCHCFEANTEQMPLLKHYRKNVYNYAIADENKDNITFNVVMSSGWTAGFSAINVSEEYKKIFPGCVITDIKQITVNQRTLNTIIKNEIPNLTEIDVMSIDIEGGELNCLKGIDLNKYKPKLLVIENVSNDVTINRYLENFSYRLDKQVAYNQFFIHSSYSG
jgi:FkbM family methyltransferase